MQPRWSDSPRCHLHQEQAAIDTCHRCGAFVCLQCVRSAVATVYCGPCLELRPAVPQKVSAHAWGVLALSCLGLVLFPCALAGAFLGWKHLRAVRAGQAPDVERRHALAAVFLGALGFPFSFALDVFVRSRW